MVARAVQQNGSPSLDQPLKLLGVAFAYFTLAKGGLALASLHPSASPVWPPSGLALAAFLLWGNRVWPAIAAGAFFANVTALGSVTTSVAIAAGNTLEAFVTAWLLQRWSSRATPFDTPSNVAVFAGLALAPGTMISATTGVAALVLAGHADAAGFAGIWLTWWLGDVGGQLLVTPVLLLWARCDLQAMTRADWQRLAGLLGATILVGLIAFSPLFPQTPARGSLAFLAIVPLLWAALRHDQRDTATAALVLCMFAIWGTLANGGPFARPSLNDSFLLVMVFVISTAVPSLVLSADVAVRRLNEERYRTLVEYANDIVATLDTDMRFTSVNPAVQRILGYAPEELIGTPLSRYVPQDQMAMHADMLNKKLQGTQSTQYEMELFGKDGEQRFTLEVNSRLILDAAKRPVAIHAIAREISERKNAEARQVVLVRELQHRTKNLLAVIQTIARNSLQRSRDLESARKAFEGRLHALAHAQDFIASGAAGGVPLRDLVEKELAPLGARTTLEGVPLVAGGSFAQMFALIVHELGTNAAKYGSLSSTQGTVAVSWRVDRTGQEPQFVFSWIERGGPPASEPADSRGFGTQLISLIGTPTLTFKPEGFEYTLVVPLAEVVKGANA